MAASASGCKARYFALMRSSIVGSVRWLTASRSANSLCVRPAQTRAMTSSSRGEGAWRRRRRAAAGGGPALLSPNRLADELGLSGGATVGRHVAELVREGRLRRLDATRHGTTLALGETAAARRAAAPEGPQGRAGATPSQVGGPPS